MRTRVKICGITNLKDALSAVNAGADALGFVFYPPSPRYIDIKQAKHIISQLPPFVTTVALFVNADIDTIKEVVDELKIDMLQFHGDECADYCQQHNRPWIKAIRMKPGVDLEKQAAIYNEGQGILLDAYQAGVPGGTGETFDWDKIPESLASKIILAGGLDPENIQKAITVVHPYAVDVSGGVEAEKGIKDSQKINEFMRGIDLE